MVSTPYTSYPGPNFVCSVCSCDILMVVRVATVYWQGSSLAGCFTSRNFARRLRRFFTPEANTCKSDHTAHFHTSKPFQFHFKLAPVQTSLLICFQWKCMECSTLTALTAIPFASLPNFLHSLCCTQSSTLHFFLNQIRHRSFGNFSSSTFRMLCKTGHKPSAG